MKSYTLLFFFGAALLAGSCRKADVNTGSDFAKIEEQAISDFVHVVAIPGYDELKTKASILNTAISTLNIIPTDANLDAAKIAWRDLRVTWERCEGYLFGPVEDDEYDPETDTWPVSFNDLDSLLASSNPLGVDDIEALNQRSLKGYHPIEYVLWGKEGLQTAAGITDRQKQYVTSLSLHLKSQAEKLYSSWAPGGGNYGQHLLNAGKGSTLYPMKKDAFLAILEGMLAICEEVGEGKMKEPFDTQDPNIVESPFSGNSVSDFRNNITGALNVYKGKFNDDGVGLNELVRAKNIALDNEIQQKFNTAINSFNSITKPFEQAIISERIQCQTVMDALEALSETLDTKLRAFIQQNITD
ncbi:MAG: hypothetical protein C5B52_01165 [Bacteroidetes bacterium]|nr:MAG: hypothetical protein C5B52_01165 [Bacteroidota bacterium]